MRKRLRPKQHRRRLRSGKVITVNKGVKRRREKVPVALVLRDIGRQSGSTNIRIDKLLQALPPGERVSKNGKVYWETRQNRSDINPEEKL